MKINDKKNSIYYVKMRILQYFYHMELSEKVALGPEVEQETLGALLLSTFIHNKCYVFHFEIHFLSINNS